MVTVFSCPRQIIRIRQEPGQRRARSEKKKREKEYLPAEKLSRVLRREERQGEARLRRNDRGNMGQSSTFNDWNTNSRGFFFTGSRENPTFPGKLLGPYCGSVAPVSANRRSRKNIAGPFPNAPPSRVNSRKTAREPRKSGKTPREKERGLTSVSFVRRFFLESKLSTRRN